jgi:type II secretory pathway pseudopilin PulG
MTSSLSSRNGISLLEVLISIGILAVGLTSVLSFIPAGHSMAKTSLVTDQAAIVASNALADLATQGFLRADSLSVVTSPVIIDPLGSPGMWTATGANAAVIRQAGVFANPAPVSPPLSSPASQNSFRSRDDVTYDVPDSDDDVTNRFADDSRAYKGNFSWLAMLTKAGGGAMSPGDEVTLSVVVFHNRDLSQPPVSLGTYNTPSPTQVQWSAGPGPLVSDRKNSEFVRSNGVCLVSQPPSAPSFRRIAIAAINANDSGAFLELDGAPPSSSATIYGIPDAVAVAEKTVTLEASTPYSE